MPGKEEQQEPVQRNSKAAYLMVKGSIGEDLTSKEELTAALHCAGYNPTGRSTSHHWTDSTKQMTYSQFCNITEIEPPPTEDNLVSAFQKLDEKRLGYITHEDFLLSMTTRGERLPGAVIERLLEDTRYNRERKFYYPSYCRDVMETCRALCELAVDKLSREEEDFSVNSKTYKVRRKTASPDKAKTEPTKSPSLPPSIPPSSHTSPQTKKVCSQSRKTPQTSPRTPVTPETRWRSNVRSKGCLYLESDAVISHQYQISVPTPGLCRLSVQAEKQYRRDGPLPDIQLYLFDENKRFLCRTGELKERGLWVWEGKLEAGRYLALAQTSGARLRRRRSSPREEIALVERFPQVRLTREFQEVLQDMYSRADLDSNGTLSREEFNLFNWRTSGEEVSDTEWSVVEANFPLQSGELTLDGFLTLHQMEAEDNEGDPSELRVTVAAMGYSRALVQDESASFTVNFSSLVPGAGLLVTGLKSGGVLLEKTVTRCAIEGDKSPTRVKGAPHVLVYREVTDHRITFVYQNKSESSVTVQMDLSRSLGSLTSRESSVFNVTVPKKSSVIAAHILPQEEGKEWRVESTARIVRN